MAQPAAAPPPSAQVPPAELPASIREAGLANWIREPLDDAVDRRRRVIVPPAVATMGTPLDGCRGALMALRDFYERRLSKAGTNHMLQSAKLAREHGLDEKVIMACLVHDIAVAGLLSANHGYWGAQLVAPYVDEEVAWAIEKHEPLRYFPDESVGYAYPQSYIDFFGADYRPPAYLCREAEAARKHRWYMTSRLITINDFYSFDPGTVVDFSEFEDVVGRHFRQPSDGLGFDGSPVAHMWRTMIWPNNFL
jgi:hypothetical protein